MFIIALLIIAPGMFCYLVLPDQIAGLKMLAFFSTLSVLVMVWGFVLFVRQRRNPPLAAQRRRRIADYEDERDRATALSPFNVEAEAKAAMDSWGQRQNDELLGVRSSMW